MLTIQLRGTQGAAHHQLQNAGADRLGAPVDRNQEGTRAGNPASGDRGGQFAVAVPRDGSSRAAAMTADLRGRVEDLTLGAADPGEDLVRAVGVPALLPLLELDDDRVLAAVGVVPADHAVEALRGQGELVLEEDAVVGEGGVLKDHRDRARRVLPRRELGGGGVVPDVLEERELELARDLAVARVLRLYRDERPHLEYRAWAGHRPQVLMHGAG